MVTTNKEILTSDEWCAEVVRISNRRGYAEWFYADETAWKEHYSEERDTPEQAVDYNVECLF